MNFIIYYSIALTLLWIVYKLLLSQTLKLNLNRVLLLCIPLLPIFMFFIGGSDLESQTSTTFVGQTIQEVTISAENNTLFLNLTFWDVITSLYFIGAIVFAIITLANLFSTISSIKKINFQNYEEGIRIAYSADKNTFSFFNKIHICEDLKGNESVLAHEIVHVRQKHSLDIMLFSIYKIVFWFHPVIHLLNKETKLLHEYIADNKVSNQSSKATYANKLLNIYFGTGSIQFINQFNNQKFIKMRLKMLSKNEKKSQVWKYITVPILLVVLSLSVSSFKTISSNTNVSIGETDPVYDTVDVMPEYKGGIKELFAFIGNNVKYPKQSANAGVEGKCMVEFIVTKSGAIKDAKILKGVNDEIDAESLRVINAMPNWTPGEKDGKKVNVKMVLPIAFKLSK